jgi:hypothetical protein
MCGRVQEEHGRKEKDSYHQNGDAEESEHDWYYESNVDLREQTHHKRACARALTMPEQTVGSEYIPTRTSSTTSRQEHQELSMPRQNFGSASTGGHLKVTTEGGGAEYEHYTEARPHDRQHAEHYTEARAATV